MSEAYADQAKSQHQFLFDNRYKSHENTDTAISLAIPGGLAGYAGV